MKIANKVVLLLAILMFNFLVFAFKIDFLSKTQISKEALLQVSISFCITEDNIFLVVDFKGGDVKIYKSNGELAAVLGRKGFGPNEFAQPLFCHYENNKFVISDVGQRKFFIYERQDKFKFIRSKEIFAVSVGNDLQLDGNRIYITGSKTTEGGITYQFNALNLDKNDQCIFYLPGYLKYGLNSEKEFKSALYSKPDISAIGGLSYFDLHGDFAYYLWEGNLKVFKINLKTKDIITFGKKTANYIQPYASNRLINAFSNSSRDGAKVRANERKKLSYVRQIFTTQKHVLVIYEARDSDHSDLGYMMQFYTLDGNFIKEVILPQKPGYAMCFDKRKNVLYSIKMKMDSDLDESHYILKYKIHENENEK